MNIKSIKENLTRDKKIIKEENLKKSNYIYLIKGTIISIIITMVFLLLFSIILANTTISENTMVPVVTGITAISLIIGSIISSKNIMKKGILYGTLQGLIYIIIIYTISSITKGEFLLNYYSMILVIAAMLAGMLGGIIGVNIKK